MTDAERDGRPEPEAPGYGDQGPAGAGRDPDVKKEDAADHGDEPEAGGEE